MASTWRSVAARTATGSMKKTNTSLIKITMVRRTTRSTMDTMKEDFTACRHRYKLCGGQVNANNTDDDYLFAALKASGSRVSEHGRSVGDHAKCSNMFDADLQAAVMHHERHLVREFNLGSCCP